jgi:hypothetical protein
MANRNRPKAPRPLTWRQVSASHRSPTGVAGRLYLDSTRNFRIEQLIGYSELPFVAAVHDYRSGRRSPWRPIGRYATMDEAAAACARHRQTPERNGDKRFNEAGDPLPRKFWE